MDLLSFSTQYIKLYPETDVCMSSATSFLYAYDDMYYLITNGHNITRVNPDTNERIIDSAAFPVKIKTTVRASDFNLPSKVGAIPIEVPLYEDDSYLRPRWYIHPSHGYNVDVVAIPWAGNDSYTGTIKFYPLNGNDFDPRFQSTVSDDVFILGYPLDINGGHDLPIWKRGTISTEPSLDLGNLPKFMVDTATRSGMSGSPVIMQRKGFHQQGTELSLSDIFGTIRNFAGIYSGRIGSSNELEAQLGIVWKPQVIDEILNAKKIGDIDFQNV